MKKLVLKQRKKNQGGPLSFMGFLEYNLKFNPMFISSPEGDFARDFIKYSSKPGTWQWLTRGSLIDLLQSMKAEKGCINAALNCWRAWELSIGYLKVTKTYIKGRPFRRKGSYDLLTEWRNS